MVKSHEEDLEYEQVKFNNKLLYLKAKEEIDRKEHLRKMDRLKIQLEIAVKGGTMPTFTSEV